MSDEPHVLLTNDDGVDAPGLRAMRDRLADLGEVTVVAPATDRSAVGRALSYGRAGGERDPVALADGRFSCTIPHEPHDHGYAVRGTPCDCVILGVGALEPAPDLVVAGCNPGANLGAHVLGRSGTASAAVEAAVLGVPAVAASVDTLGYDGGDAPEAFADAADLTARLAEHALAEGAFEAVDYLNVNAPRPDRPIEAVEVTRPTPVYEMDASFEDGEFRLHNRLWEQYADGDLPDPPGTDRRALLAGRASVSPLRVAREPASHEAIDEFAGAFG